MKDYLAELVRTAPTPAQGRNVMRGYLQARILGCLQRDVRPFLEPGANLDLLTLENVMRVLG